MSGNNYIKRNCPICNNHTPIKLEISSRIKGENLDYINLTSFWNGFYKEKIFFSYSRCSNCSLLFAPNFYNEKQLQELYAQMAPNMELVPMEALIKTQADYFNILRKWSELKGGYIEIGPDIGIFTSSCSKYGNFNHYWLCEPNNLVAEKLANAVQGKQYKIIKDMFSFELIPDGSSNVAVMIQVLDHLLDPVITLEKLRTKLVTGSKLLIVTHNEQSLLRKLVGWRWPAFCLQHPQIYNPKSITALLDKSGFKVESIEKSYNYFEISFLLKHLFWALGFKINSIPKIFNIIIGIKLGNIITIATPK